jgi:hypothetical protein
MACLFCGRDLWDVGRYVSSGPVAICDACIADAARALQQAAARGETEVLMPPRVFGGSADADRDSAREIAEAFRGVFGGAREQPVFSTVLEDGEELGAYLLEGRERHGNVQSSGRVNAVRFTRPDRAEVRFHIDLQRGMGGTFPMIGEAVHRDGRWLVSRETFASVLARGGIQIPPRASDR